NSLLLSGLRASDAGNYCVEVRGVCTTAQACATLELSNSPPVLAPVTGVEVVAGNPVVLTLAGSDPDLPDQRLEFALDAGAPAGATIDATNGVFRWTPTEAQAGTNTFVARLRDNGVPVREDARAFAVVVRAPLRRVPNTTLHLPSTPPTF